MDTPRIPLIPLLPSLRFALVLGVAHAAMIALLPLLTLSAVVQAGLGVLLLFSAVHSIRRHALRLGVGAIDALDFSDRTRLRFRSRDGHWHSGEVLGSSTVLPVLVVLNVKSEARRLPVHVVIPCDGADADALRQLRVWLRWGPRAPADVAASP